MTEEKRKTITRKKRVAQGHKLAALMKKGKKKYCVIKNSLRYSLQNSLQHSLQNSLKYSLQNSLQYSLQYSQMELVSMALVYLLSLPSVFVYFLHITLFSLKIKNLSIKNTINHQKDVICFRKKYTINE